MKYKDKNKQSDLKERIMRIGISVSLRPVYEHIKQYILEIIENT
jgi:hypothetical protein